MKKLSCFNTLLVVAAFALLLSVADKGGPSQALAVRSPVLIRNPTPTQNGPRPGPPGRPGSPRQTNYVIRKRPGQRMPLIVKPIQ
uniref:Uncharacterized protein n=1 Tax=Rhipicephalus appendiculatus TaxID=34631 RepID=A0A131YG72_RHIAP